MAAPLHVVILAAGEGKRMKSAVPKVLQKIAGRPMLAQVVDTARELQPAGIHVVYGHGGEQVRAAFRHLGKWGLMFGYFVPGIRHLTAIVAGAAALEFSLFAMFAYAGAAIWSVVFITLGIYVGDRWEAVTAAIDAHVWLVAIVAAAAGAAALIWVVRRRSS